MGTVQPLRRKVAIVGTAPSWIEAPFDESDWAVWGLNGGWSVLPRWDRWFEMHTPDPDSIAATYGAEYVAFLGAARKPVYTQEKVAWIPSSVAYPVEEMTAEFGERWASTPAYMLALAISQGFKEIGIYGIDNTGLPGSGEYRAHREWLQYLIGIACGKGITVTFPESGSAMERNGYRYGYQAAPVVDEAAENAAIRERRLALKHYEKNTADMHQAEGAHKVLMAVQRARKERLLTDAFVDAALVDVQHKLARAVAGRMEWEGVAKGAARIEGSIAHIARSA